MIRVTLNGQQFNQSFAHITTMPDLVEYIKASIDPDQIITSLSISGRNLADVDWRVPLSVQGESTLEVTTDTQNNYVRDRLKQSANVVDHISAEFACARESFQEGKSDEGNRMLSNAVRDLSAFLNWYDTILKMVPSAAELQISTYNNEVQGITKTCENLLQQQLYHSWWALSETVKNDLEPRLERIKESCESVSSAWR